MICIICNKELINISTIKYNDNTVCKECLNTLLSKGVNVSNINNYSLDSLKTLINKELIDNKKHGIFLQEIKLTDIDKVRDRFIAFDTETTGLDSRSERIVELGAALFVNGKVERTFNSLVNAETFISKSASMVNHITNEMISRAPSEKEVYNDFIEFMGDALDGNTVVVAHNAGFDMSFLSKTFERLEYDLNVKYLDTVKLSRKFVERVPNHKLGTLANYFKLVNDNEHRAFDDAKVCGEILLKIIEIIDKNTDI